MHAFDYPCPGCRTTTNIHSEGCSHSDASRSNIESTYLDIVEMIAVTRSAPMGRDDIRDSITDWGVLHDACFEQLEREHRIGKQNGGYVILTAEERRDAAAEPDFDPMKTIYERGSVPGCHDNAVFAMVAYYEMVDMPWEETRERVIEWLEESGTWERGGFSESTPEELVDSKKHVYDRGYGWKEKAEAAKRTIEEKLGK